MTSRRASLGHSLAAALDEDIESLREQESVLKRDVRRLQQELQSDMESHARAVAPVSQIKLPPYFAQDATVWFGIAESIFSSRNITSEKTKFHYVIANLGFDYASEVRDVILNPPPENPYSKLKSCLIQRTSLNEKQRIRLLLAEEQLGDRTPSQFLRRLQQLLGFNTIDCTLLRELFTTRLPERVQTALATVPTSTPLEDLAGIADSIMSVHSVPKSVYSLQASDSGEQQVCPVVAQSWDARLINLERKMSEVSDTVSKVAEHFKDPKTIVPSTSFRRRVASSDNGICYYHNTFGGKAKKCREPCKFHSENDRASH